MASRVEIERRSGGAEARPSARVGSLSRDRALAAVTVIVLLSAAGRLLAARSFHAPWIAPDEMVYGLSGRAFWETGHVTVLGQPAPFYGAYPLLVGLPLHLLGTAAGVAAIQVLQALLMSLTAAVVWAWARPLAGDGWALAAAALTACLPALAYSGLLMSEAVFLPAGTLAVWLAAHAIARPTLGRQAALVAALALALAARLQGIVLVPVVVTAALLAAWFGRDAGLLRRLAPTWLAFAAGFALWALVQVVLHGTLARGLGAYSVAATAGYEPGAVATWVVRHAGDLYLLVLGVPLLAAFVLAYEAGRGREHDPGVRALAAVSVSTSVWLTLQVGTFASRYVGQLAERHLIVAAPPLFACLAVWLARGLPRPRPATSIVSFLLATPAVLLPVAALVTPAATPDAFMTVPLARLIEATSLETAEAVWMVGAALAVAVAVLVPARAAAAIPLALAAVLLASSAQSSSAIARLTQTDREKFFGTDAATWIDDAASGPVAYVHVDSAYWNAVWSIAFWNDRIDRVVRFPSSPHLNLPSDVVRPDGSGTLRDPSGRTLEERHIVAPTSLEFVGRPLATVAQVESDQAGLRLWRTVGAPRLSSLTIGLKPNGDIVQPVRILVYDCRGGRLELTLLGKSGAPVLVLRDGRPAARLDPEPGGALSRSIPVLRAANGPRICIFEIRSLDLVGSTRLRFVRG